MNTKARPLVARGSLSHRIWRLSMLVMACTALAAGLAACERGADSGATANPVAPGRPGTGNPVEQVAPTPDPSPQSPQVGGTTQNIPAGITGSGGPTDYPGAQGNTQPPAREGIGTQGGLGTNAPGGPAASPAAVASAVAGGGQPQQAAPPKQ